MDSTPSHLVAMATPRPLITVKDESLDDTAILVKEEDEDQQELSNDHLTPAKYPDPVGDFSPDVRGQLENKQGICTPLDISIVVKEEPLDQLEQCLKSTSQRIFETMDNERFILEVEKHKVLYDATDPFYKDNTRKDKAWNSIGGVFGVEVDVCKVRWKALRDAFVRSRKKNLPSGSAGGNQKDWKYTEIMSFLLPHLRPRSSKSNLCNPPIVDVEDRERCGTPQSLSGSEEPSSCSTPGNLQQIQRTTSRSPTPSLSIPTTSRERERPSRSRSPRERLSRPAVAQRATNDTRRRPQTSDIGEWLMSILEEPIPKPHMPDDELDESYHFALSLVPILHRLDKDRRQQAKISILNNLHNLEKGTAQHHQTTVPPQLIAGLQPIHPPSHTPQPPPTQEITGHSSCTSRPVGFRPIPHPPQNITTPTGPYTQMLPSSNDPQWEDSSTGGLTTQTCNTEQNMLHSNSQSLGAMAAAAASLH
ncbi:uncharacterized protein LOC130130986 [Lampris incognitus]|uniref:uncharacterized protein LOC130130986 n=1 Tax=Lampris incognitus TaxID=2546036 RepID=UPI0024B49FB5|nr:uncharacterized protein LOC130130986 [Lampris incognitus]